MCVCTLLYMKLFRLLIKDFKLCNDGVQFLLQLWFFSRGFRSENSFRELDENEIKECYSKLIQKFQINTLQEVVNLALLSSNTWQAVIMTREPNLSQRYTAKDKSQWTQAATREIPIRCKEKKSSQRRCWTLKQVCQRGCGISTFEDTQNVTKPWATWSSFEVSHALSRGLHQMISKGPFQPKLVCDSYLDFAG